MTDRKISAIYEDGVFKPIYPQHIPEHSKVEIVIRRHFIDFLKSREVHEAQGDIDQVLSECRSESCMSSTCKSCHR